MKHPKITVEVATAKFSQMLRDLGSIDASVDFRRLVLSEAGNTIAGKTSALSRTVVAKVGAINKQHENNTHSRFRGKTYNLKWRYPDELWAQITEYRKKRLAIKLAARGLAKQSWMHAAVKLGFPLTHVPDYVLFANYRGKTYPEDVEVIESGNGQSFTVEVRNNSPMVNHARMPRALVLAMWGRAKYFEKNMAHGVFRNLASRAKTYPGIWTSPVPASSDFIEI